MSPELWIGLQRGIVVGIVGAGLAFFTQLGVLDAEWRSIISATGIGFFTPLGGFVGYGALDAAKAAKPGTAQHAARHIQMDTPPHE